MRAVARVAARIDGAVLVQAFRVGYVCVVEDEWVVDAVERAVTARANSIVANIAESRAIPVIASQSVRGFSRARSVRTTVTLVLARRAQYIILNIHPRFAQVARRSRVQSSARGLTDARSRSANIA